MNKATLRLLLLFNVFTSACQPQEKPDSPYVVMVSFDGFRHDYVQQFEANNFQEMIRNGVSASAMQPSYPSKTFPNHYTLVTGLYPDHHGLVDNTFYDAKLDVVYGGGNRSTIENADFYGGLPLWQLAQQNGMRSASYFWVGSEAPVAGFYPDYYHIYDGSISNEKRILAVTEWLELPADKRPQFITLYFSLVDTQGHRFGPESGETREAVQEADRLLGMLRENLASSGLPIDLIVVSDHGMQEIPPVADHYIALESLTTELDTAKFRWINNGAHAHFYLKDKSQKDLLFDKLKEKEHPYTVYRKEDLPASMNYGSHNRVGDVMVVMEPGYYLSSKQRIDQILANTETHGEHGFDPRATKDMDGIFYAIGPSFKKGLQIGRFENIHVYPLVATLLGISEWPAIDGRSEVLAKTLNLKTHKP